MLSVEAATAEVLGVARPLRPIRKPLIDALGSTLAEDITAEIDLPPFDKSLVDGYAIRSADLAEILGRFRVVDRIVAGAMPSRAIGTGEASTIATGAPLPDGADSVVMFEYSRPLDLLGQFVELEGPARPGQNRLQQGREIRRGQVVLRAGDRLDPVRSGVLASLGRTDPLVVATPIAALVTTGNEVVPADQNPGPGQIRDSNAATLAATIRSAGYPVVTGPIALDELEDLQARFAEAVGTDKGSADVLIVSGGVSAGPLDLVPAALDAVGVVTVFHKVRIKPGKPLFFGVGPARADRAPALVFGLPGNPVSGLVGTLLFALPRPQSPGRPTARAVEDLDGPTGGRAPPSERFGPPTTHRGSSISRTESRPLNRSTGPGRPTC